MKQRIRAILLLAFSLLIALSLSLDGFNTCKAEAAQNKRQSKSRKPSKNIRRKPVEPSPAEIARRREEIHRMMLKGEYQHDGAGELLYIGNMSSVPALLRVLKDNPPITMPDGRKSYICTYAHAAAALGKITGHKATSYEEWVAWWEQYQKSNPK
jgi:hypothetical protein